MMTDPAVHATLISPNGEVDSIFLPEDDESRLRQLQGIVGGYIEVVSLPGERCMVINENGKEKNRYEYNPDRVFTDLEEDGLYKVSDFDNLTIRPAYKDLKADKLEDGQKDSNGKYIFYLQKGGKISGSLLNDLIKKGINAEFIEYASEKDYDTAEDAFKTIKKNAVPYAEWRKHNSAN